MALRPEVKRHYRGRLSLHCPLARAFPKLAQEMALPSLLDFEPRLRTFAGRIEARLDQLLPLGKYGAPRLVEAMRYALLAPGKRIRPFFVAESAHLFGVAESHALMAGAAIECVHCYSLVHDDLPAMDDDDLRRGRPTVHKAFDEATAILAGDSLLTFAFDILARPETHPDAAIRIALVQGLARAAGIGGMAGGQMLDLAAEGRFGKEDAASTEAEIMRLQAMKTGAILKFSCVAGAILGGAPKSALDAVARYGQALGQAFQIADDL